MYASHIIILPSKSTTLLPEYCLISSVIKYILTSSERKTCTPSDEQTLGNLSSKYFLPNLISLHKTVPLWQNGVCCWKKKGKRKRFEISTLCFHILKLHCLPFCFLQFHGHERPYTWLWALDLTPIYFLKGKQNTHQRAVLSAFHNTNLTHHIFNHSDVCIHVVHAPGPRNLIALGICTEPCTLYL